MDSGHEPTPRTAARAGERDPLGGLARVIPLHAADELTGALRRARRLAGGARPGRPRPGAEVASVHELAALQVGPGSQAGTEVVPAARPLPVPHRPSWEARAADALTFALRRVQGDYAVDDYGFDPDLTEHTVLPLLKALYDRWFRVEVNGIENVPADGGALLVANHAGGLWALDATMTAVAVHTETPGHRFLRLLGAELRLPLARASGRWPASRRDAGLRRRRRAAARGRRAGRRLARGVQGHRQAVPRAVQAAALRPRRVRAGRPRGRRADHPGVDRRRRGDPPGARQRPDAGPPARPAVLPADADVPLARAARARPAAEQVVHRVRRARSTPAPPARPPTTRLRSSTSPTGCARRSSPRCTGCWCSAVRSGADRSPTRTLPGRGPCQAMRRTRRPAPRPAAVIRPMGVRRACPRRTAMPAATPPAAAPTPESGGDADAGGLAAGAEVADLPAVPLRLGPQRGVGVHGDGAARRATASAGR